MKVRKLTTTTLKRIIAEERQKLREQAQNANKKKRLVNNKLLEAYVAYLKKLKTKKAKTKKDLKRIEEASKLLKSQLLKRI